jgi:hypothetical protein
MLYKEANLNMLMNKSNEQGSLLMRLLRKLKNSPASTTMEDLKKFKKERKRLEKELKEKELEIQEIVLRKSLDELDPDFDKKLECLLKTPPLKLKDLKEQLKRERSEAESAKQRERKQSSS